MNTQILSHPSGAKVFLVSDQDYATLKRLAENATDENVRRVLTYVLGLVDDVKKMP